MMEFDRRVTLEEVEAVELDSSALSQADLAFIRRWSDLGGTKADAVRDAIAAYLVAQNLPPHGPSVQVVREREKQTWVHIEYRGVLLAEGRLEGPRIALRREIEADPLTSNTPPSPNPESETKP